MEKSEKISILQDVVKIKSVMETKKKWQSIYKIF